MVLQISQPQVCYTNPKQDMLDLKFSMCRKISNVAKTILSVNITGKELFESTGSLSAPAPPPPKKKKPFTFTSSKVDSKSSKSISKPSTLKSTSPPSRYPLTNFMGLNILSWNCQGIRPKRKELELYLKENSIDIIALNETLLNKKYSFKIPGYDTIRNDRSTGRRGGVAFLVKHDLVINKEYRNKDFNKTKSWQSISNFLITKTSLWLPFTARMEILTLLFSKP